MPCLLLLPRLVEHRTHVSFKLHNNNPEIKNHQGTAQCVTRCSSNGGCSVKIVNGPASGKVSGSCFPPSFGGSCSGVPEICKFGNHVSTQCGSPCQVWSTTQFYLLRSHKKATISNAKSILRDRRQNLSNRSFFFIMCFRSSRHECTEAWFKDKFLLLMYNKIRFDSE